MSSFKKIANKQLGEVLVERGIITKDELTLGIAYQQEKGGLIGEILVTLKFASEEDIAQALTCQYGFPYLPLSSYEIDLEVIKAVHENVCRQFCLIPLDKIGKSLTVAMANPLNVQAIEDIELITGCSVQTFVSTSSDVRNCIGKYYKTK